MFCGPAGMQAPNSVADRNKSATKPVVESCRQPPVQLVPLSFTICFDIQLATHQPPIGKASQAEAWSQLYIEH